MNGKASSYNGPRRDRWPTSDLRLSLDSYLIGEQMICDQCRTAGESLRDPSYGTLEQRQDLAARIHARCVDPATCACQHRTDPDTLNKERIHVSNETARS